MKTVSQIVSVSILLGLLAGGGGTAQAATFDWDGGDGAWETASNWKTNGVIADSIPIAGDAVQVMANVGTARVTTATGNVPISGGLSGMRVEGAGRAVIQTGGAVSISGGSASLSVGNAGGGTYELQGGTLYVGYYFDMCAWASANQIGYFIQSGGTSTFANVRMNYKGSNLGKAYIEVTDGELNCSGHLTMAYGGGSTDLAWLTQSGGKVTVGGQLQMATAPVSGAGSVIVNLNGGEMTIKNATPLTFGGGTTNYFNFAGGTLYVKASAVTNYASLTAIANSDFRLAGVPITADSLQFTAVDIGGVAYTAITNAPPPPTGMVLLVR